MNYNYPHNPILANDIFVPDAEAHVWEDGRIYLYGSFDIKGRMSYCSDSYHVFSSDDMVNWVDHGEAFALSYTDWAKDCGALYAPDCAYRNGTYYLYYCIPDGRCGVAKSTDPKGPFVDVGPLANVHGIDPAVLIDDDGQAYLYWGQFDNVRVAKLKENMVEIEPDTIVQPLSVAEHEFHEGSSVKKIGSKYYYMYCDTHRHGRKAVSLGYSVSDNPMTGFKYGGIIIDNFGCDPRSWNNHGSMQCFDGQWYIFYHRSTHNCEFSRHVCVEPITINEDGSIDEVKMTSSGVGSSIKADIVIPACFACELSGNVRIAGHDASAHILALTKINSGDTASWRYLEFNGENEFTAKLHSDKKGRLEVYIDGRYITSMDIRPTDGLNGFENLSIKHREIVGKHELTLKFYGDIKEMTLDEIKFSK